MTTTRKTEGPVSLLFGAMERFTISRIVHAPADDTGAQIARLERYAAWARGEIERLAVAGEHPERRAVLRENLEGVRRVLARILAQRTAISWR